jgi:hypothetical protein
MQGSKSVTQEERELHNNDAILRGEPAAAPSGDFFAPLTIEQLIAEQHVHPIADISILSGAIPDEDVDEFVAGLGH